MILSKVRRLRMKDYKEIKSKLELGKNVDINLTKLDELDDIEKLQINRNVTKENRVLNFIKNTKNPYMMNINGIKVKFEFTKDGASINECLEKMMIKQF